MTLPVLKNYKLQTTNTLAYFTDKKFYESYKLQTI